MNQIFLVKNSLGETAEKPRHAVFKNVAPGTKKRGFRVQVATEGEQIVFVATCAVQQEQSPARLSRNEDVTKTVWRFCVHRSTALQRFIAVGAVALRRINLG